MTVVHLKLHFCPKYFFLVVLLNVCAGARAQVIINELMRSNRVHQSENGEFFSWLELLNTSNGAVTLSNYYIQGSNSTAKSILPSIVLPPQEVVLLWLSGKELEGHTAFVPAPENDSIYIFHIAGVKIDSAAFPENDDNESFGRHPEEKSNWIFFSEALISPGVPNAKPGPWVKKLSKAPFKIGDSGTFGCLVFDDKMWILNYETRDEFGEWTILLEIWASSDGVNWILVNDSPPYRHQSLFTVYDGYLWAFDGRSFRTKDGVDWEQVSQYSPPRGGRVVTFKEAIWILHESSFYRSVDGIEWELMGAVPWLYRPTPALLVHNNKLYAFSGVINYGSMFEVYFNDVWSSSDGVHWDQVTDQAPWRGKIWTTYVSYEGRIWILGGYNSYLGTDYGNDNEIWTSVDGKEWEQYFFENVWSPRHAPFTWNFEGSLWLAGGYGGGGVHRLFNDVWKFERSHGVVAGVMDRLDLTYGDSPFVYTPTIDSIPFRINVLNQNVAEYSNGEITVNQAGGTTLSLEFDGTAELKPAILTTQLDVHKRDLHVFVSDTCIYRMDIPPPVYYKGFVGDDTLDSLSKPPTPFIVNAPSIFRPGRYEVDFLPGKDINYNFITHAGNISLCYPSASAYPNPTRGEVWLRLQGYDSATATVLDINGVSLLRKEISVDKDDVFLDLSELEAGIYIIRIQDSRGESGVRVVKY